MDELDKKIIECFPGKSVRKDLTNIMKKGANVPTYVLEYLLGMYCATDDEEVIAAGMEKIKNVLSENYVKADQSEYIKSKIIQYKTYTVIDKISVRFAEESDCYVASFQNLELDEFKVSQDLVIHNEKLLLGGIWCLLKISYHPHDGEKEEDEIDAGDLFIKDSKKKKKTRVAAKYRKYDSVFSIDALKPIQMPNLDMSSFVSLRSNFTKEEWIDLLLRSAGYEPDELTHRQKLHYLLRFVPLVQKNYNLVELGPRGTGKSHLYSEISPYSILISAGHTTVANMFYNIQRRQTGLVGYWDTIAFDEVGGMNGSDEETIQTLKNYMANGSFARGTNAINADASIAFEGNTFRTVEDMIRTSTLFEPFPGSFNSDSAFFDRIHAYLPGWETPKLRPNLLTKRYGLISDCLAEFCHGMRRYDFTNLFAEYFELNSSFNTRDDIAVRKTFSGLAKLIYPNEVMSKEECREILEYSIEARRRVKEQLKKLSPSEFNDVELGYIDIEDNTEYIIDLHEQPKSTLVFQGYLLPGHTYGIGKSVNDVVGVYKLENTKFAGTGQLLSKNIEGVQRGNVDVKTSINAAFNYFTKYSRQLIDRPSSSFDFSLYFSDLQKKGISEEVSVAEVVGLFSCLADRPVMPALTIVGRVVISGSMMPVTTSLEDILIAANNAGSKRILLPLECMERFNRVQLSIRGNIIPIYYETPLEAAKKALEIE